MDIYTNIYNAFSYKITPHSINFFQQTQLFVSHHYDRCVISHLPSLSPTAAFFFTTVYYCCTIVFFSLLMYYTSGLLFVVML